MLLTLILNGSVTDSIPGKKAGAGLAPNCLSPLIREGNSIQKTAADLPFCLIVWKKSHAFPNPITMEGSGNAYYYLWPVITSTSRGWAPCSLTWTKQASFSKEAGDKCLPWWQCQNPGLAGVSQPKGIEIMLAQTPSLTLHQTSAISQAYNCVSLVSCFCWILAAVPFISALELTQTQDAAHFFSQETMNIRLLCEQNFTEDV